MIRTEKNPWQGMRSVRDSYVLDQDRSCLRGNDRRGEHIRIIEGSIPEPFIGNPHTASVVLLGLNPGHSEEDQKHYRKNELFREAIFANLRHDRQEYPFYPLNPDFRDTPVAKWWLQRTRALREALGKDELIVSKRLMAVEWFPYHSSSFDAAKHTCESQAYSQDLVKQLCADRKLIIGLRGQKHWDKVVPGIPYLRSWQSSYSLRAI